MLKLAKLSNILVICLCLLGSSINLSATAEGKKDPCLKNNNGIGNNYDIFVELPTSSLTIHDLNNQILSIRIDPGNPGQMEKFRKSLKEKGFNPEEINFVVAQIPDAEMKAKTNNLQCALTSQVKKDYTLFAD
jgi:hypothetical protein